MNEQIIEVKTTIVALTVVMLAAMAGIAAAGITCDSSGGDKSSF